MPASCTGRVAPSQPVAMAQDRHDVAIAGAGAVGATLGLALKRAGLDVVLVDAGGLSGDSRSTLIAAACFRQWSALGIGEAMAAEAQAVHAVQVADGPGPGASDRGGVPAWLRFGEMDAGDGGPLGYMVENARLRAVLDAALTDAGVPVRKARVLGLTAGPRDAVIALDDGASLTATLVVGAEGRRSAIREAAGIKTWGWDYPQSGVAATVALEHPHEGVAQQYFLKGGPLAVLPLTGQRASLVWTELRDAAEALVAASPQAFEAHLSRRFGEFLGQPKLIGARERFPLSLQAASSMTGDRVALAGDAAHGMHPIAGQGLNLGLKDAAALAEVIVEARRLGEDWGSALVLDRYAAWRRVDVMSALAGTELFARVFSGGDPILRRVRSAGLALVGASPFARRLFTREATGSLGDAPRLLRGEPL